VSDARRGRILVVDDELGMCQLVDRMLCRDHEVTTTTEPRRAIDLIRDGARFDLIIADVMMPVMNGVEMRAAIAEIDPPSAERLVFLTASVLSPDLERRLAGLPNPVLRKPVSVSAMRAFVKGRLS